MYVADANLELEIITDYFIKNWTGDQKTLDIWAGRIRKAASQPGFDFEPALRRFLVYVLVGSKKHSWLTAVKDTDYPKKHDIEKSIVRVARLIKKGASRQQLKAARADAAAAAKVAYFDSNRGDPYSNRGDIYSRRAAYRAHWAAQSALYAVDAVNSPPAASQIRRIIHRSRSSKSEFAAALLYFVEQEAYGRGKRRGNPASEKVPSLEKLLGTRKPSRNTSPRSTNPKIAKKTARRKVPAAKTLISKCQKAWDHYCERPSKKRLKEVFDHLDKMKESSAKTVKDERARCLRAANKEAKRLGMKK